MIFLIFVENHKRIVTTLLDNIAFSFLKSWELLQKRFLKQNNRLTKVTQEKAYLRYFLLSVVSQGLFLEKHQTKCFPLSIVSTKT